MTVTVRTTTVDDVTAMTEQKLSTKELCSGDILVTFPIP